MATETLSPGTVVDDDSYAFGSRAWSNPGNAAASDDARATVASTGAGAQSSHYLKATDFGFGIPTGATVDGIVVEIEASTPNAGGFPACATGLVRVVKGGIVGSTDAAVNPTTEIYTTDDTYITFGDAAELWGETWAAEDINAANFGVAVVARLDREGDEMVSTARVDHIRVSVHYTEATEPESSGAPSGIVMLMGGD
jgi:hypothetical protein